jgi:hypothetical protein
VRGKKREESWSSGELARPYKTLRADRGVIQVSYSPAAEETAPARSDTGRDSIPVLCEQRPGRRRREERKEEVQGKNIINTIRTGAELDYSKSRSKLD